MRWVDGGTAGKQCNHGRSPTKIYTVSCSPRVSGRVSFRPLVRGGEQAAIGRSWPAARCLFCLLQINRPPPSRLAPGRKPASRGLSTSDKKMVGWRGTRVVTTVGATIPTDAPNQSSSGRQYLRIEGNPGASSTLGTCLLYTSDAADD